MSLIRTDTYHRSPLPGFDLLPHEHWQYSASDALDGLRITCSSRDSALRRTISIPEVGTCYTVRSGRVGILLALQALALPPGARVGVPLYCCPVVFKAIAAAGCKVRFMDIDPSTYCISASDLASKSTGLDAVIAVHMFGNACDVPALRLAVPGIPVIEDCAQALGSQVHCRALGSFGDLAVFSFRSGKYLSVGEGGAVCCGNQQFRSAVSKLAEALAIPTRREEAAHVIKTYLRTKLRARPLWGFIGAFLWNSYSKAVSFSSQSPIVIGSIYNTDRELTLQRLQQLDRWIDRQRSNARYYCQNLLLDRGMLCLEPAGTFYNRLQYPLLLQSSEQCAELSARLRADGISTSRPYKDIAAVAAEHYNYTGDCPRAEQVAARVLVVPCHHALKAEDVERTACSINRAWQAIRERHHIAFTDPSSAHQRLMKAHREPCRTVKIPDR